MSLQTLVALAALVTLAAAQALTVNTPTSVQSCLPVAISWTGGVQPVYVSLIPGGQPGGAIVKDFGVQNGNTLTWKVDQPAGTSLSVQIRDSSGALNYSDKFEVQPSTASCTGDSSTPTKPGSAAPPVSTSTGSTPAGSPPKNGTSSPTNPSATTPSSGSTPSTGSTSSTGSTTPTTSNPSASGAAAPAAGASSDASRTIPAIFVVVLSAATAVFA